MLSDRSSAGWSRFTRVQFIFIVNHKDLNVQRGKSSLRGCFHVIQQLSLEADMGENVIVTDVTVIFQDI